MLWHSGWLEQQVGVTGGYRNLHISPVSVVSQRATINAITSEKAELTLPSQLSKVKVNPFEEQDGTVAAIRTDNWWMVRGVNFGVQVETAKSLILRVQGTGNLSVYAEKMTADPMAVFQIDAAEEQDVVVDVANAPTALVNYLYFVANTSLDNLQVLSWQFSTQTAEEVATQIGAPIKNSVYPTAGAYWYSPLGFRTSQPQRGLNIVRRNGQEARKVMVK